mgnify:CR=1 FL=1
MRVLFIGGTGIISSACSQLALEQGIDLYLLNRGQSNRPSPPDANILLGDIRDPDVASVEPSLVHVPSDFIAAIDPNWGAGLLGDKAHSVIFDNSKIKSLVPSYKATIPFHRGVHEILAYYDADPARQVIDEGFNQRIEQILAAYGRAWQDSA